MFWQSVLGGLAVLAHWQVWVALVVYTGLRFAWLIGIGMLAGNCRSAARMAAGCLTHIIGGTVLQSLLLGALVLFLTPLMLGGDQAMPLAFFRAFAWPIVLACLIALVVSLVLLFIPIVGTLVTDRPGLNEFIQGTIIFRLFSGAFIERLLQAANLQVPNLYPGFWATVGYFVLATVLVHLCFFIFAAFGTTISRSKYSQECGTTFFVGMAVMPLLGLLPLFMYGNHVALAIQKATG